MVNVITNDTSEHASIQALITDAKPQDVPSGSTLALLDPSTGKVSSYWLFDSKNTNPVTGDGWWQI